VSKLYIIGNGFDLHFGLHTNTDAFKTFLQTKSVYNVTEDALEYFNCYGVNWADYELSIAGFDFEELEMEKEQFPDYLSDHERDRDGVILDMEMLFESLDHAIDDALHDMVKAANEQIRKRIARKKIKLLIYHLPCQSSTFTDFIIIMNL